MKVLVVIMYPKIFLLYPILICFFISSKTPNPYKNDMLSGETEGQPESQIHEKIKTP